MGLTWNGQYQLSSVFTNGIAAERNGFDAFGRRVWNASINSAQAWETNWFVYNGQQVLGEMDSTGGLKRTYIWGPGIDNLLAFTTYTGATAKTYFALTDHLGSVHALADETGSIVESYRFDAWGRVLGVYNGSGQPLTESAMGNRYLWQGREYSFKTTFYFFRSRFYSPVEGRWLSNDRIGIAGGLNMYQAFNDNPVNFVDPFGFYDEVVHYYMTTTMARQAGISPAVAKAIATYDEGTDYVNGSYVPLDQQWKQGSTLPKIMAGIITEKASTVTLNVPQRNTMSQISGANFTNIKTHLPYAGSAPDVWSRY